MNFRPDLLEVGEFTVARDGPSNLARRRARAPAGEDDWAAHARLHELTRAALTPANPLPPDIDPDILEAVNNARINLCLGGELGRKVPARVSPGELQAQLSLLKARKSIRANTLALIDSAWSEVEGRVQEATEYEYLPQATDTISNSVPRTWADTLGVARRVQAIIEAYEKNQENSGSDGGEGESEREPGDDSGESKPGNKGGDYEGSDSHLYSDENRRRVARMFFGTSRTNSWAPMHIEYATLSEDHPVRHAARKIKPRDFGEALRFIERDLSDERVFGSIRHVRGGTILIDNSSSMQLSQEAVMKLVTSAPNAEIAHYSGRPHYEDGLNRGQLSIVAQHSRVAKQRDMQAYGSGNLVDGPALEWLATRRKPLLWVSDGQVTGLHDHPAENLQLEARLLVARNRIRQVHNVSEAIALLQRGGFR